MSYIKQFVNYPVAFIAFLLALLWHKIEEIYFGIPAKVDTHVLFNLFPQLTHIVMNEIHCGVFLNCSIQETISKASFFTLRYCLLVLPIIITWLGLYVAFLSTKFFRIFYGCLLIFIPAFEYGSLFFTGKMSTFHIWEVTLLTTLSQKFWAIESFFTPKSLIPFMVYMITNIILIFSRKKKGDFFSLNGFAIITASIIVFYGSLTYFAIKNQKAVMHDFLAGDKTTTFTATNSLEAHYIEFFFPENYPAMSFQNFLRKLLQYPIIFLDRFSATRIGITLKNTNLNPPKTNIVLIIDESVVSTHLDINGYMRETVPVSLKKLSDLRLLKNWGTAVSATTTSIYSNHMLLTGIPSNKYEDLSLANLYPTIFQYAKARGYTTHYYDAQLNYFWNGKPEDIFLIDEYLSSNFFLGKVNNLYETDFAIARHLKKQLGLGTNHFIVINKAGVHAPYSKNYPITDATWLPITDSKILTIGSKENILKEINHYDNALKYNFEIFWNELFANPSDTKELLNNTIFIYTSDHGQGIDFGIPHGGNTKAEASVPLILIGQLKENCCDTSFKASHSNILPTILDLMEISSLDQPVTYSHSLLKARINDSQPRFFIAISKGLFKFDE